MKHPAVIWDMGGLIYRYFTEMMIDIGLAEGWPLDRVPMGPTGNLPDPDYQALQVGDIDEPEYVRRITKRLAAEGIEFFPEGTLEYSDNVRPETWEVIERIHSEGHPQALLTNDATRWLGERWWETWRWSDVFEAMIDVENVGTRKPFPEPYLVTAAALCLEPSDCLFLDDLKVNCRGAEAVGMASIYFDVLDVDGSLDRIVEYLGLNGR